MCLAVVPPSRVLERHGGGACEEGTRLTEKGLGQQSISAASYFGLPHLNSPPEQCRFAAHTGSRTSSTAGYISHRCTPLHHFHPVAGSLKKVSACERDATDGQRSEKETGERTTDEPIICPARLPPLSPRPPAQGLVRLGWGLAGQERDGNCVSGRGSPSSHNGPRAPVRTCFALGAALTWTRPADPLDSAPRPPLPPPSAEDAPPIHVQISSN